MKYVKEVLPEICDVTRAYQFYFKYLLGKLNELFVWKNLPDTIDETFLNNTLYLSGRVCFTDKLKNTLMCYYGNPGGEPDAYYVPTLFTIANPVMGSANVVTANDKEGVLMFNSKEDKVYQFLSNSEGLFPLIHQTATLLADNIVSINTAQINSRVQACIIAGDDNLRSSAEVFVKDLYRGKPWQVISESMISNIKVNPIANTATPASIQALIELHQYIIADFYNSIGIKTNPVNKKERLITDEINSVDTYIAVTLEQMLKSRQEGVERINRRFGTNISVELSKEMQPVVDEAEEELDNSTPDGNIAEGGKES